MTAIPLVRSPEFIDRLPNVQGHGMWMAVVTITPQIATAMLETNTHNRPISQHQVNNYARAMESSRWRLNGEAIIFDKNWVLQNGQHRLWACAESGESFDTVVIFGVASEAYPTYDTGKPRNGADALSISGHIQHRTSMAAAATLVNRYDRGNIVSGVRSTNEEIVRCIEQNPDLEALVLKANSCSQGLVKGMATILSSVLYIGSRSGEHSEKAKKFLEDFHSGASLTPGNPVLALRNRVLNDKKLSREEKIYVTVSAWNAYALRRTLEKVSVGKNMGKNVPSIVGAN